MHLELKTLRKISTAVITQGFSLLTLQLQTRLKQPRMKGHKRMLLPQGRTLHVDGVSLGSRTLKLQRLQFQQPWVKKQSSHVCSQNTEWEIWAADKRNTFLCHFEIPRREGFCDKVYRQCVRIPVHLWVCQPRCLHGSVMTMLGEG